MKNILSSFLAGLRFLTILPISWRAEKDDLFFQKCIVFFTPIGLLIGVMGAVAAALLTEIVPPFLLASLMLLYLGAVSGFLHLDGLADTADGFFSSRSREQVLAIMRDSRSGAMAVAVLIFIILIKFAALLSLQANGLVWAVVIMPAAGRCAIVLQMTYLPYAREGGGLGALFYGRSKWTPPVIALLLVCLAATPAGIGFALGLALTIGAIGWLFGQWCLKIIGGTTGDTLGAACELTETAAAVVCAVYFNM